MCAMVCLADLQDARWRKQRIHELARRWGIPPEQVIDSLLLESYLQEIVNGEKSKVMDYNKESLSIAK